MSKKQNGKKDVTTTNEKPQKKQSAGDFVMRYLCDNPGKNEEQVQKALEKAGFKRLAEPTI